MFQIMEAVNVESSSLPHSGITSRSRSRSESGDCEPDLGLTYVKLFLTCILKSR